MRRLWMAVATLAAVLLTAGCGGVQKGPGTPAKPGDAYKQQAPAPQAQTQTPAPAAKKQYSAPPAMQIDTNKQYTATIKTSMGDIKVELLAKDAPKTVNNFVFLAREKFYDGVIFHRIMEDFMIQTGDPKGTGSGGPGYRFEDELPPKRSYDPGIVAMANAGKNTNGSQFFICNGVGCKGLNDYPNYTQFGLVIEGMDVVQKLSSVEVVVPPGGREKSKPVNPPVIETIIIDEK
ncbi:MAG TPA: peptidylprolyl isomerase [Symbiobacteriaceae bacterium]|nr:peptidylprolyl isomerase [Symbiobacteriaceae bacterium]